MFSLIQIFDKNPAPIHLDEIRFQIYIDQNLAKISTWKLSGLRLHKSLQKSVASIRYGHPKSSGEIFFSKNPSGNLDIWFLNSNNQLQETVWDVPVDNLFEELDLKLTKPNIVWTNNI